MASTMIPWAIIWLIFWAIVLSAYYVRWINSNVYTVTTRDWICVLLIAVISIGGVFSLTAALTHEHSVDTHITDKVIFGVGSDIMIFTDDETYIAEDISLYPKIKVGEKNMLKIRVYDFGGYKRVVGVM